MLLDKPRLCIIERRLPCHAAQYSGFEIEKNTIFENRGLYELFPAAFSLHILGIAKRCLKKPSNTKSEMRWICGKFEAS
jgi:hypothetical protein